MPDDHKNEHNEMLKLLRENNSLAKENNVMLKKLYRYYRFNVVIKIIWFAVIIGLPFAVYFYVLEPYFAAFGANYETFRQGMAEIPGLKGLERLLPAITD